MVWCRRRAGGAPPGPPWEVSGGAGAMGMLAPMWVAAREGGGGARVGLRGPKAPTGPRAPAGLAGPVPPFGAAGAPGLCQLSFVNLPARRLWREEARRLSGDGARRLSGEWPRSSSSSSSSGAAGDGYRVGICQSGEVGRDSDGKVCRLSRDRARRSCGKDCQASGE